MTAVNTALATARGAGRTRFSDGVFDLDLAVSGIGHLEESVRAAGTAVDPEEIR
jgi:hypothetical protein